MSESEVWAEIGRRVRLIRKWRGLTQEDVANRVRLVRASIVNAEAGRQKLPVWNLLRMSVVFEVPPHIWLLMPDDWVAWCKGAGVTAKRVEYELVPRTFKRLEKVVEEVEAA